MSASTTMMMISRYKHDSFESNPVHMDNLKLIRVLRDVLRMKGHCMLSSNRYFILFPSLTFFTDLKLIISSFIILKSHKIMFIQ
ncbi:hypothetical protein Hanom_Chr07g00663031 [Helianthus anomalus]